MAVTEKKKTGGRISPATEFKKGQSGNPNGRPPKLPDLQVLLAKVLGEQRTEGGPTEAEMILNALRAKARAGDIRAAELLLDRGYGKARQTLDLEGTVQTSPAFTDAQIDKILSAIKTR